MAYTKSFLRGEKFRFPEQAKTLELIATTGGDAFYRGNLSEKIANDARKHKAALSESDLDAHRVDTVETIFVRYGDLEVHELPPNSQGLSTLLALGIFSQLNQRLGLDVDSAEYIHLQLEAMKLAFADADAFIADADYFPRNVQDFLQTSYFEERARLISVDAAKLPAHGIPPGGGTVYVTVGDKSGMMVSFIQSNWWGFGSGVIIPGTGISLHNRASSFGLKKGHPNEVGGRKKPFHTLIPGFAMKNGKPFLSFGLMGGSMQAQGHFQLICRIVDGKQNPQAASDAPRWRITKGLEVMLEEGFCQKAAEQLTARGHQIAWKKRNEFGGAQIVCALDQGGYLAASDRRKDGYAASI